MSREAEARQVAAEESFTAAHLAIPNLVLAGVPAGGEGRLRGAGRRRRAAVDREPRDHLELGETLGLIDMERGAKVSGSRFYFSPPRCAAAAGTVAAGGAAGNGQRFHADDSAGAGAPGSHGRHRFLGSHAEEVYRIESDDLYLVGTSEVPLAGYHAGEILDLSDGPRRYAGWSSCFRREAGSYGKRHPRHHQGAPVRQGRGVRLPPPRRCRSRA